MVTVEKYILNTDQTSIIYHGCADTFIPDLFLLCFLLADVFLDTVVQNGADAKSLVFLDQWLDGPLVLTGNKLAIECHLHDPLKDFLTQDLLS